MENFGLLIAIFGALFAAVLTGQVLAAHGFPIPEPTKRIGYVDGLRGYLALLVMMHHFDLWSTKTRLGAVWGDSSMRLLHNFGPGGVMLFFMATGLVFYPRIERGFRQVDWRTTYLSRVFRILPLQVVMVAIVAAISFAMAAPGPYGSVFENAKALVGWLTSYVELPLFGYYDSGSINAYVLWSLWQEWMFYLFVLPLLAIARDLTRERVPAYVIPVATLLISLVARNYIPYPTVIFFLPLFATGMIAFELRGHAAARRLLSGRVASIVAVALLLAAMLLTGRPHAMPQLIGYALFFCCIAAGNSFGGLFGLRGSIVLGEISFGIYMIHAAVLYGLYTFVVPDDLPLAWLYATLPLATVVVVLVSAAAHLVIERPGIALGRRLSGRSRRPFSPAVERETANLAP